jgi:hypothetical protein
MTWSIRLAVIFAIVSANQIAAQTLRGRVVEAQSRQAVPDVEVLVLDADSIEVVSTTTDDGGFFRIGVPALGTYLVAASAAGFGPEFRRVEFTDTAELVLPAFVLTRQVIPLDTLRAEGRRAREDPPVGFGKASHVLAGERMAVLERHGVSIYSAVRELGGSLRQRRVRRGGRDLQCIESTRRIMSMRGSNACEMVVLVIDGIVIGNPLDFLYDLQVRDYESIEYVAPVEAGNLYGRDASAFGALVFWTRGYGPHTSGSRNGGGVAG